VELSSLSGRHNLLLRGALLAIAAGRVTERESASGSRPQGNRSRWEQKHAPDVVSVQAAFRDLR
jgi:hypothetical protein